MYTPARPKFSGPRADLVSRQWARLALAQEIRKSLDWATQLVASGRATVREALALIQVQTVEAARNHAQQRKQEKELRIRRLETIDGIGSTLAERLVSEFGTLEAVADATPEQLYVVDGVGKRKARTIAREIRRLLKER